MSADRGGVWLWCRHGRLFACWGVFASCGARVWFGVVWIVLASLVFSLMYVWLAVAVTAGVRVICLTMCAFRARAFSCSDMIVSSRGVAASGVPPKHEGEKRCAR